MPAWSCSVRTSAGSAASSGRPTGLQEEFGADRCIDTPLAESGIVGAAIGMALYGMRPVPEIQFGDYIYPAYDQIVNELAKFRYRSGGEYPAPVVIRTPIGGGIKGGHYHSQSPEALFTHVPGLKVVLPVEPDRRQGAAVERHPRRGSGHLHGAQALLPRGARRRPRGRVHDPARRGEGGAAARAPARRHRHRLERDGPRPRWRRRPKGAERGYDLEVIDLRTLVPFDLDRHPDVGRRRPGGW